MAGGTRETPPTPTSPGLRVVLGAVSLLLIAGGWFLPLWVATLYAPQYPGGLSMRAYGHDVTGDVDEISGLNHYVGMRAFDLDDFPEIALWPYALAGAVVAVGLALLLERRWLRRFGLLYLWATPIGVLAVIQVRLHQYGQDLDPNAALRIDPFTPLVIGPTEVWNFMTWSWPGLGLVSIVVTAALLTFGPRLILRIRRRLGTAAAAMAVLAVGLVLGPLGPAHATTPSSSIDLEARLAAAEPGQRIVLPPGVHAGPVVIDTPVVLEGRPGAVIQGNGTGSVITVRAADTVVRGVGVRGSGEGPTGNPAGIRIEADRVSVEQVIVEDSYMGLAVESAADVRLVDNVVLGRAGAAIVDESHAVEFDAQTEDAQTEEAQTEESPPGVTDVGMRARGDGIWLHDADHVLVRGNQVSDSRDGIYVSFGSGALLDTNEVATSRYAVHSMFATDLTLVENHFLDNLSGAVLMYRGPVLLLRNRIEGSTSASTGFGVLLKDVVDVEAVQNVLIDNRVGIHLDGPPGGEVPAEISANTVARNTIGIAAYPSARASFRANSFVNNRIQVLPQGGQLPGLVFSREGTGNLWSTYRGFEARTPGRGATPHVEGGSVDRLLGRHPELLAVADGPGFRVLRAVQERWGRQAPVVVDELPLTIPVSPMVEAPAAEPLARWLGFAGAGLLLLPLLTLLVWQQPRRTTVGEVPHAIAA